MTPSRRYIYKKNQQQQKNQTNKQESEKNV